MDLLFDDELSIAEIEKLAEIEKDLDLWMDPGFSFLDCFDDPFKGVENVNDFSLYELDEKMFCDMPDRDLELNNEWRDTIKLDELLMGEQQKQQQQTTTTTIIAQQAHLITQQVTQSTQTDSFAAPTTTGILGPASSLLPTQETLLQSAFSTMTLHDPTLNMDTGASSHLNSHTRNLSTIYNKDLYNLCL